MNFLIVLGTYQLRGCASRDKGWAPILSAASASINSVGVDRLLVSPSDQPLRMTSLETPLPEKSFSVAPEEQNVYSPEFSDLPLR